ncbi:dihydroxyacetone kinase phosphoryl donor subunit DhaM [Kineococcus indalonis]|uniref:dihydroxyacetone kinase phosphoryl donor subunit DhaM n=1 Tax=Kineococcus indalonis TaxID=2696566 RepID=UPI001412E4D8|nr:dihydroxyacetone kinase phosphoryl donor subunit DhaM [Kineococcus indalonis]NAZ86778.1 PTS fructose transporter subunit IIA [Kineococcus indalonis]
MSAPVRLVLLSHSAAAAAGVAELAAQVAGGAQRVRAVGGTADGGLGTSADALEEACRAALDEGADVAVLVDLGSAVLTAKAWLAELEDEELARVRLVDAPFLEGAVAAAVTASTGAALAEVVAQAEVARGLRKL